LHGVVVTQVQHPALGLTEPRTVGLGPSIQMCVLMPLQSLPTLKQIDFPAQLGVLCKLTEGALNPLIQIIDTDVKQDWPQNGAWGTPLVTGCQLDLTPFAITLCDRPFSQFFIQQSIHPS